MFLLMVYIISTILSWILTREWYLHNKITPTGLDIFLCLCPIVNTVGVIVLGIMVSYEKKYIKPINSKRFFLIK